MRGRPRTQAPDGYVTVSQAADLLGITRGAVHGRMERGTLAFEEHPEPTQSGGRELRIYIRREEIERAVHEKGASATKEDTQEIALDIETNTKEVLKRFEDGVSRIERAIASQEEKLEGAIVSQEEALSGRLDALSERQERIEKAVKEGVDILRTQAESENGNQERVRRHERTLVLLIAILLLIVTIFTSVIVLDLLHVLSFSTVGLG